MKYICWVDRRQCIVVRNRRAVKLGLIQFAIFYALHTAQSRNAKGSHRGAKTLPTRYLLDEVYRGVAHMPETIQNTLHQTVRNMNEKLAHVGLRVHGVNRGIHSFYQIVTL